MIRKSLMLALVMVCAGAVFAATKAQTQTLTGYVIDNACSAKHAGDAAAIEGHAVSCALMPPCTKSGYALYSDGKLLKFDSASNKKVEALLKSAPADQKGFQVKVEGTVSKDMIHAKTITPVS